MVINNEIKIGDLLNVQNIKLELSAVNMEDTIFGMVNLLCQNGHIDQEKSKGLIKKFVEGEGKGTTGLGGVATPYVSTDMVSDIVLAVGISTKGIDFNAVDEEPVHVVFMIVTPDGNIKGMVEILSSVKSLLIKKTVKDSLRSARNEAEVMEIITQTGKEQDSNDNK